MSTQTLTLSRDARATESGRSTTVEPFENTNSTKPVRSAKEPAEMRAFFLRSRIDTHDAKSRSISRGLGGLSLSQEIKSHGISSSHSHLRRVPGRSSMVFDDSRHERSQHPNSRGRLAHSDGAQ